jgi:Tol biopolymer transport system component
MNRLILSSLIIVIAMLPQIIFAEESPILLVENDKINKSKLNIMILNGSKKTKLTENGLNPVWSPDLKKIAFLTFNSKNDRVDLSIMNHDGTGRISLTEALPENIFITNPTWFPNSREIAYIVNNKTMQEVTKSEVNIIDIRDKKIRKLPIKEGTVVDDIAVSHGGDKIAYVLKYRAASGIYILDLRENKTIPIKSGGVRDILPMWSKDDKSILFCSVKNMQTLTKGPDNIPYDILAADSKSGLISTPVSNVYLPFYAQTFHYLSPDSKKIIYFKNEKAIREGNLELYDLITNKTSILKLDNFLKYGDIIWSKDGRFLLYISYKESVGLFINLLNLETMKTIQTINYEIEPNYLTAQMFMSVRFIGW